SYLRALLRLSVLFASPTNPDICTLSLLDALPIYVLYPEIDSHPAGFSTVWLQDILRDRLGFEGVIFSDDLEMAGARGAGDIVARDRKSTRLNSSHEWISYAVFCLKKKSTVSGARP